MSLCLKPGKPIDRYACKVGIVAGVTVVTRSLRFRIRVGPAQTKATIVFSAKYVMFRPTSIGPVADLAY